MGSNNSKASKKASEASLGPKASIGTPNPESVARWTKDVSSTPGTTAADGKVTQPAATEAPAGSNSASAGPSSSTVPNAPASESRGQLPAQESTPAADTTAPKETATTEISPSSVSKAEEAPPKAGLGVEKSGIRENPVFEDETHANGVASDSELQPETTEAVESAKPAKAASEAKDPLKETATDAPTGNTVTSSSVIKSRTEEESSSIRTTTPLPEAKSPPKPDTSEIQPDGASSSAIKSAETPIESKAQASGVSADTTPKPAVSASTASGAQSPVVPAAKAAPRPAAAKASKKASQDKVAKGGCFGCFGPSKKAESARHDPGRPSIGTPTGFVPPEEAKATTPEKVESPKTATGGEAAVIAGKSALSSHTHDGPEDQNLATSTDPESPARAGDLPVTVPKTPEKPDLPSPTETVTGPATPEQLPPSSNLPTSVVIDTDIDSKVAGTEDAQSIKSPVIMGSGLSPLGKDVQTSPVAFEEPAAERLTITGDLNQNSPEATEALVRDTKPDAAIAAPSTTNETASASSTKDVQAREPQPSRIPKLGSASNSQRSLTDNKPSLESQAVGESASKGISAQGAPTDTVATSVMLATVAPEVAEVATEHQPQIQQATESLDKLNGVSNSTPTSGTASKEDAIPIAAVAPEVAEVAAQHQPELAIAAKKLDKETEAKELSQTGSVIGKNETPPAMTSNPSASSMRALAGSPAPSEVGKQHDLEEASEKQAVAAALRHGDIIQGETIHPDLDAEAAQEPALQDAVQKQNVAKALREDAHHTAPVEQPAEGTNSVQTTSTEDFSTLAEPGTPHSKASSLQAAPESVKEDASEGSRGARLDEAKIGERQAELPIPTQATGRRSRYTAVHDNPEFESSPTDTLASKDPTLEGSAVSPAETASVPAVAAEPLASATASREIPEAKGTPASPFIPSQSSKKTFETPELPEATKKTEEMDKKMELKLQKSREREEKAKEKLRQKSLKKRSSRGFFGLFGGSSKNVAPAIATGATAGPAAASSPALAGPPPPQEALTSTPATVAPQAAAVSAPTTSNVAAPIAAGVGAGAATGLATGLAASSLASKRAQESAEPKSAPVSTSEPAALPAKASEPTPAVAPAAAPTEPLSAREIRSEVPAEQRAATTSGIPAAAEPTSSTGTSAFAGFPQPVSTAGSISGFSRAGSEVEKVSTPVSPAEVALDEQSGKKQKLKKVKSKKVPRVDHSAALMSQTPSVVARKQAAASAYPGGPGAASGEYAPMRAGNTKLESTLSINRQKSLKRQPSGKVAANGGPMQTALQSLNSMEFKGPKAPMSRGIQQAEVSYARNYSPMSTATGTALSTKKSSR